MQSIHSPSDPRLILMLPLPASGALPLRLAWLGAAAGGVCLMLSEALPLNGVFLKPSTAFTAFMEIQVFFVLLLWPLLLEPLVREGLRPAGVLLEIGLLLVFAGPLTLVCADLSDPPLAAVVAAIAFVAALAAFVAGLVFLGQGRGWRVGPWYFGGAFLASTGVPLLAFWGAPVSSFRTLSPFWVMAEGPPLFAILLFGVAGAVALALAQRRPAG